MSIFTFVRVNVKSWGPLISLMFFLILFLAEKSIQKQLFQYYKKLFTFRFAPQKSWINVDTDYVFNTVFISSDHFHTVSASFKKKNVELHPLFLTSPFHCDVERTSVPMINVELHTFLISSVIILKSIPFHLSILCKIVFTASKFEIIDLFLNFKQTDFRTNLKLRQHLKLLIVKFIMCE